MMRTSSITLLIKNTSEDNLRSCDEVCLRTDSDASVEDDTNRVFIVGHKFFCLIKRNWLILLVSGGISVLQNLVGQ